jgi:hypothetical protein
MKLTIEIEVDVWQSWMKKFNQWMRKINQKTKNTVDISIFCWRDSW